MDWIKYLNTIYRVANVEIKTNERVVVVEIDYIRNLFTLLDRTPMRTVGKQSSIEMIWFDCTLDLTSGHSFFGGKKTCSQLHHVAFGQTIVTGNNWRNE